MTPQNLHIVRADSSHPSLATLTTLLDLELSDRYGEVQATYDQFNKVTSIDTVVIAMQNDLPVGCGCFKKFDSDSVELKRMFVLPTHRGKGVATEIIHALEQWAIALYTRLGYQRIPNFGPYAGMPASVCLRKIFRT